MTERAAAFRLDRIFDGFEFAHGAHDIADADPPPLARQAIAAARPPDPDQHLAAHQLLQYGLQVAARNALARRDLSRPHRRGATVIGDIEDRLDREEELFVEPDHVACGRRPPIAQQFRCDVLSRQVEETPVEPNPPDCRSPLTENALTTENSGRAMRVNTSCAMRSPGRISITPLPGRLRFHTEIIRGPS